MAGNERLAYEIAAIYTGSPEIKKAFADFAQLNAQGQRVVNQLDRMGRQAKKTGEEIRNSRAGAAQLGMQFNQLGTQVVSGTNVFTAFAQQIGDVGYAMTMMGGRAAAVGRFFAGPWGIALGIGAVMLSNFTKESDKATKSQVNFADYSLAAIQSVSERLVNGLEPSIKAIGVAWDSIEPYVTGFAKFTVNALELTINATAGFIVGVTNMIIPYLANIGGIAAETGIGIANYFIKTVNFIGDKIEEFVNGYTIKARAILSVFDIDLPGLTLDIPDIKQIENAYSGVFAAARKASVAGAQIMSTMDLFDIGDIRKRARAIAAGRADDEKKDRERAGKNAGDDFGEAYEKALKAKLDELGTSIFSRNIDHFMGGPIVDGMTSVFDQINEMANAMYPDIVRAISAPNEEMIKSFESIGASVDNAFKGMLTAGMSWKDGMKGIINSVINELWRLYVTQQIVGMVSNAIGGLFGGGGIGGNTGGLEANFDKVFSGRAIGGSVSANTPYIVGERGPELFVPGGNGTIIPNKNMSNGGGAPNINVTVDARGSADPAAVREQVQRGILEAAPAIVAAAQQRTISTLRRPKLGGAMQ